MALPLGELSAKLTERVKEGYPLSAAYGGTSPKGRGKGPVLSFIVRNDRPFTLPPGEGFGRALQPWPLRRARIYACRSPSMKLAVQKTGHCFRFFTRPVIPTKRKRVEGSTHCRYCSAEFRCVAPSASLGMTKLVNFSLRMAAMLVIGFGTHEMRALRGRPNASPGGKLSP